DFYTNWGGIYRDVWIHAADSAWIEALHITPNLAASSVAATVVVQSRAPAIVRLTVFDGDTVVASTESRADSAAHIAIPNPRLWSPDSPHLYRLCADLMVNGRRIDSVWERFGMREIRVQGRQ